MKKNQKLFYSIVIASMIPAMLSLFLSTTLSAQTSDSEDKIRLILRGDDMGISHSSNTAIIKAYTEGLQKSTEVIVTGPWFPEAVRLLNEHPGLDVGVHLSLTSEWENLKWRPLSDSPSLTDSIGYFQPFIWPNDYYDDSRALLSQDWKIGEVERELRMQIELALSTIENVTHLSYHMGMKNMAPEVNELVEKLAIEYNLNIDLDDYGFEGLSFGESLSSGELKTERLIEILKDLTPGNYILVTHPDLDTTETRALHHIGYENVAQDRQSDTDMLTSPKLKKAIQELGIQIISYSDLSD